MYRKKNEPKTNRLTPGLSRHAVTLFQRRHQRLYRTRGRGYREHSPASLPTKPPSFAPTDILSARQSAEAFSVEYISITLLGEITMKLHSPNGLIREVPLNLNPKTNQLMAYIAWQQGIAVKRDKLIMEIWGYERADEEEIDKKLGWAFEDARKALRGAILKVLRPKDSNLDVFRHKNQMWWLSPCCKVIDLEVIEEKYRIIREAKKRGGLINAVPEHIKDACYELIMTYSGDFCETLLKRYPLDLKMWANAWVREPITYYRDCYLQAVWYAAEYERKAGQQIMEELAFSELESRWRQREYWARAVELYRLYAMHACNNQLDTKVYFNLSHRGNGERVTWSERALRECVILCGKLGDPYLLNEIYSAYYDQMRDISDENWQPSEETLRVVQAARELAAAYQPEG
jgi:hypothetical protein